MKTKQIIIGIAVITLSVYVHAQSITWQPYGQGTPGATNFAWNSAKTKLYKGTYSSGVYLSLDSGISWQSISSIGNVWGITMKNDTLYAQFAGCLNNGIFYTLNDGVTWYKIDNGFNYSYDITSTQTGVFVANYTNIAQTYNNGQTWQMISTPCGSGNYNCSYSADADGSVIGIGGSGKVHVSTDNGVTWNTHVTQGAGFQTVWSLCVNQNGIIYAGTTAGLYRSVDYGNSWNLSAMAGENVSAIRMFGQYGFAASTNMTNPHVYYSNNFGVTWSVADNGLPANFLIMDFTKVDDKIITAGGMYAASLNPLGIEVEQNKNSFSIAPNPVSDQLSINAPGKISEVSLINFQGIGLCTWKPNSTSTTLSLKNFPAGIYSLKLNNHDNTVTKKVVIYH